MMLTDINLVDLIQNFMMTEQMFVTVLHGTDFDIY